MTNARGSSLVSTLIAAGVIAASITGVAMVSVRLQHAMKKSEASNLAVVAESHLIYAFHDKANFPNPTGPAATGLNSQLRSGILPMSMSLNTPFGLVNLNRTAAATELSASGFLNRGLGTCAAFDSECILQYQIRMQKVLGSAASYAFSYQVDLNPDVISMTPLGDINSFNSPLDPGLYRADQNLTKCDPVNDLFMTGMNRDTGEAFCVERPAINNCPVGKIPKGLEYIKYTSQTKAGTIKLRCTNNTMRTFNCPLNYSLQRFEPPYADPDNTAYGATVPGSCVFRTGHEAYMPNTLPANPTSPYMRSISGTVCPPYYEASEASACQLVPNATRNSNPTEGLGRCGTTQYKDCQRPTYTDVVSSDGGAAYAAWTACMASTPATCGPAPANPVLTTTRTCSFTEVSRTCNRTADIPTTCSTVGTWSLGTAYAASITTVPPTAVPVVSFSGRQISCTFNDTSTPCTAPALDVNGTPYGKKDPKWYGGVKVSGAKCTYDPSFGPETVSAF